MLLICQILVKLERSVLPSIINKDSIHFWQNLGHSSPFCSQTTLLKAYCATQVGYRTENDSDFQFCGGKHYPVDNSTLLLELECLSDRYFNQFRLISGPIEWQYKCFTKCSFAVC